jgi:hypothetical protein
MFFVLQPVRPTNSLRIIDSGPLLFRPAASTAANADTQDGQILADNWKPLFLKITKIILGQNVSLTKGSMTDYFSAPRTLIQWQADFLEFIEVF